MSVYADFANGFGVERAADVFHPDVRDHVVAAVSSECIGGMVRELARMTPDYSPPTQVDELVAPEVLSAFVACVDDSPGCTPEGQRMLSQRFFRSHLPGDPDGAPLLMMGAENDVIHLPSAHACAYEEAVDAGLAVERCFLAGAEHSTMLPIGIAAAIAYVQTGVLECPREADAPLCE